MAHNTQNNCCQTLYRKRVLAPGLDHFLPELISNINVLFKRKIERERGRAGGKEGGRNEGREEGGRT